MPPKKQKDAADTVKEQKAKQGGGCCGIGKKKEPPFQQIIVLLRHSERLDRVDPNYHNTPEGKAWPHDTPITEKGVKLAQDVAKELTDLHKEANFAAIMCSPFRRCLETAAPVAKALNLPLLIDQEIGEVWDTDIPKEPHPSRSNIQLREITKNLGLKKISNPILDDGGYKLFGKLPPYPETLESAKARFVVRIEEYINQSFDTKQNFIICTHADCLSAALMMFERGNADVQGMDFCARIIAKRTEKKEDKKQEDKGVYAKHWNVEFKGFTAELMETKGMEKYYEKMHVETCEEVEQSAAKRKQMRTKTDAMFALKLKADALKDLPEDEDDDEDDVQAPNSGNPDSANRA